MVMEQFFNAGKKANAAMTAGFRDKIRSFARIRYDKRCEGRYTRSGTAVFCTVPFWAMVMDAFFNAQAKGQDDDDKANAAGRSEIQVGEQGCRDMFNKCGEFWWWVSGGA